MKIFKKIERIYWRYIIIGIISIIISGGILYWTQNKESFLLNLPETEIAEIKKIAFLQNDTVFILNKETGETSKLARIEGPIIDFAISPDGQFIYWLDGKAIWKKNLAGDVKLIHEASEITVETVRRNLKGTRPWSIDEIYSDTFADSVAKEIAQYGHLKEIIRFELSPDGKYILYEEVENHILISTWLWIMRSDGTDKNRVEMPLVGGADIINFNKWFLNSEKILFHFQNFSQGVQGSPFFAVGVDGKNPEIYHIGKGTLNLSDIISVADSEPVFSPDGNKVLSIDHDTNTLWLANIDGTNKKSILVSDFLSGIPSSLILSWSPDGSLFSVKPPFVHGFNYEDEILIFNKKGKLIMKIEGLYGSRGWDMVFSSKNNYFAVTRSTEEGKTQIVYLINLKTRERKRFQFPTEIGLLSFSRNNKLYYLVRPSRTTPAQLWFIDINTGESHKIADNILQTKSF